MDGIIDQQLKQINNNMIDDWRKNQPINKCGQYGVLLFIYQMTINFNLQNMHFLMVLHVHYIN